MKEKYSFFMRIEHVFYQYGIFVIGRVEKGNIKLGDKVTILGNNTEEQNLCISLKLYPPQSHGIFRKHLSTEQISIKEAHKDDYICIGLLQGSVLQIRPQMALISQN